MAINTTKYNTVSSAVAESCGFRSMTKDYDATSEKERGMLERAYAQFGKTTIVPVSDDGGKKISIWRKTTELKLDRD